MAQEPLEPACDGRLGIAEGLGSVGARVQTLPRAREKRTDCFPETAPNNKWNVRV